MNLNNILFINGTSTAAAGAILLINPNWFSILFGQQEAAYFISVGLFFTFFGLFIAYQAFQKNIAKSKLRFITITDWLWVLISVVFVVSLYGVMSTIGLVIISVIALWVALMAFLEGKYL